MTEDEKAGIAWWNSLTDIAQSDWFAAADTTVVAEAWEFFKGHQASIQHPAADLQEV
jgi:hypothetical protein